MTMHIDRKSASVRVALACAALALTGAAAAAQRELQPPQAGDLAARAVVAPEAMQESAGAPGLAREPVAISWAVGGDIVASAKPQLAQSREYYMSVSGAELNAGVAIHTTSPRALVRLQPLAATGPRENAAIHPQALTVSDAAGRAFNGGKGMEMLVGDDKLAKADLPFAPGTSAFRLNANLGAGSFKLKANGLGPADRYLVNVVEPDSKLALTMQAGAASYLHGQELVVQSELLDEGTRQGHAASKFDATVVSPAGRSFPVTFKAGSNGKMQARLVLDADEVPTPGLWEVRGHASATVKGQKVMRSLRLAFPVAMPVARMEQGVELVEGGKGLGLRFSVEAGAPGRYEVRGLLYGSVKGTMAPIGVAHAAQWMEAGSNRIALSFAPELLANASGPFEVRDLMLIDQGRMGVLHRQQHALTLDERDVQRVASVAAAAPRAKRAPAR